MKWKNITLTAIFRFLLNAKEYSQKHLFNFIGNFYKDQSTHVIFCELLKVLTKADFKIQLKRRVAEVTNTLHFLPQTTDESYQNARSNNHETRFLCLLHNDLLIDRNGTPHQNSRVIRLFNMYALESLILNWWATVMLLTL